MGIGADIKEVFEEIRMPITITHPGTGAVVTGEYFDYDDNFSDSSTEFLRQFGVSGSFTYDTVTTPGDIINFLGVNYLILSSKPTVFEGEIVTIDSFLLTCNVNGKFVRIGKGTRNTKGEVVEAETTLHTGVIGCQYENMGEVLNASDQQKIKQYSENLFCYGFDDIEIGDRWYSDLTNLKKYRKVVRVQERKYSGCLRVYLDTDSR